MTKVSRWLVLGGLSLIPAAAFAATAGVDGGLCATICAAIGCC